MDEFGGREDFGAGWCYAVLVSIGDVLYGGKR